MQTIGSTSILSRSNDKIPHSIKFHSFHSEIKSVYTQTYTHHATHELTTGASLKNSYMGFYDSAKLHLIVSKHTQENWFWKRREKKTKQKGHHLNIKCCDPTTCVFYAWLYVCHDIRVHKETHVWLNNLRCNWVFFIFILSAFLLLMFLTLFFCCFVFILSSFGTSCSFNLRLLTVVFFVGLNNPWRY